MSERLFDIVRSIARRVPGGMGAGQALRRLFDPEKRIMHQLRNRSDIDLYQPWPLTWDDRYPELFDALAQHLAHLPEPRILSFGCSSGEEVRAIRARLPSARITGIDVNPRMIAKARRADGNPLSTYRVADRPDPAERYDAILALAVFRQGELGRDLPETCSAMLSFGRVEEGVRRLDEVLEPGGWMAITHANFRLSDMEVGAHYVAEKGSFGANCDSPIYGRDDRLIKGVKYREVLFRKKV